MRNIWNKKAVYPIETLNFIGRIKRKDSTLDMVEKQINDGNVQVENTHVKLINLGSRSAWAYKELKICGDRKFRKDTSPYMEKFKQGATLVPRSCWFVDINIHERFGIVHREPVIGTSKRSLDTAKQDYKGINLQGKMEIEFFYGTLLGSDILPFCTLPLRAIILPIILDSNSYHIIRSTEALSSSYNCLGSWLRDVENLWNKIRDEKASKMDIYARIDRGRAISTQDPKKRFRVIHNRSGTYLNACVVDTKSLRIDVRGNEFVLNGFIADSTTHSYATDDENDAYFITAFLNSSVVNRVIKPFQSRGLWGARDIYKIPFELPIPQYVDSMESHRKIAELDKECVRAATSRLQELIKETHEDTANATPTTIGRLRTDIRRHLEKSINILDEQACDVMTASG
jgi:hypothetical protein